MYVLLLVIPDVTVFHQRKCSVNMGISHSHRVRIDSRQITDQIIDAIGGHSGIGQVRGSLLQSLAQFIVTSDQVAGSIDRIATSIDRTLLILEVQASELNFYLKLLIIVFIQVLVVSAMLLGVLRILREKREWQGLTELQRKREQMERRERLEGQELRGTVSGQSHHEAKAFQETNRGSSVRSRRQPSAPMEERWETIDRERVVPNDKIE